VRFLRLMVVMKNPIAEEIFRLGLFFLQTA